MRKIIGLIFIGLFFLFLPVLIAIADSEGQQTKFFVDPSYDLSGREEILAGLKLKSQKINFYIDNKWWRSLNSQERQKVKESLNSLGEEFYYVIYPTLTSTFGPEWRPGIDNDYNITVLIHPMKKEARGYFRDADEYPRIQAPRSNEREMLYLNAQYITSPLAKSFLAHEFVHLITFNQKERKYKVKEDVWLNEARAEYAPTLLGYNDQYVGSYFQERVDTFLKKPSDSITEWKGASADYGALSVFVHYLVEKYGVEILVDSLHSNKTGIASINEALEKNGFQKSFSDIFTDWAIAVFVNDCSLGKEYCFENKNLPKIRITPLINFLPLQGKSSLGVNQTTKNWAGNWFKFIGGKGIFKIKFIGNPQNRFRVPYLLKDVSGKWSLGFFDLDKEQRGEVTIPGIGENITSVTIIPLAQTKTSEFSESEPEIPFFWEVSTISGQKKTKPEDPAALQSKYLEKPIYEMTKEELIAKIAELTELLRQLKAQLAIIESKSAPELLSGCGTFEQNLYFGMRNNPQVRCLQAFLKSQGPDIYPEGLVTGNFLDLTKAAVIRFQEKYKEQILAPLGLEKGTGFVGPMTRKKINALIAAR